MIEVEVSEEAGLEVLNHRKPYHDPPFIGDHLGSRWKSEGIRGQGGRI